MRDEYSGKNIKVVYAPEFRDAASKLKKKNSEIFLRLLAQVEKVIREPELGKPSGFIKNIIDLIKKTYSTFKFIE